MTGRRGRGAQNFGRSVNNLRIERLWRDVGQQVYHLYANLFCFLEYNGILNVDDPFTSSCYIALIYTELTRHYVSLQGLQEARHL
jgi:hypothetical protein